VCGGIRFVPDTDDEVYDNEGSKDSEAESDDSNKDDKSSKSSVSLDAQSGLKKRRIYDGDEDKETSAAAAAVVKPLDDDEEEQGVTDIQQASDMHVIEPDASAADAAAGVKPSDDDDSKPTQLTDCDKKRQKVDDVNSHGMSNLSPSVTVKLHQ